MIGLNWLNEYASLIRSATSDVRLRAKADHRRIRNRVLGIGRSDHGAMIVIDPTKCSYSAQMEARCETRGRTTNKTVKLHC